MQRVDTRGVKEFRLLTFEFFGMAPHRWLASFSFVAKPNPLLMRLVIKSAHHVFNSAVRIFPYSKNALSNIRVFALHEQTQSLLFLYSLSGIQAHTEIDETNTVASLLYNWDRLQD